jgi:hypothetical protein
MLGQTDTRVDSLLAGTPGLFKSEWLNELEEKAIPNLAKPKSRKSETVLPSY